MQAILPFNIIWAFRDSPKLHARWVRQWSRERSGGLVDHTHTRWLIVVSRSECTKRMNFPVSLSQCLSLMLSPALERTLVSTRNLSSFSLCLQFKRDVTSFNTKHSAIQCQVHFISSPLSVTVYVLYACVTHMHWHSKREQEKNVHKK